MNRLWLFLLIGVLCLYGVSGAYTTTDITAGKTLITDDTGIDQANPDTNMNLSTILYLSSATFNAYFYRINLTILNTTDKLSIRRLYLNLWQNRSGNVDATADDVRSQVCWDTPLTNYTGLTYNNRLNTSMWNSSACQVPATYVAPATYNPYLGENAYHTVGEYTRDLANFDADGIVTIYGDEHLLDSGEYVGYDSRENAHQPYANVTYDFFNAPNRVYASGDDQTYEGSPGSNYGTGTADAASSDAPASQAIIYLWFNFSNVGIGQNITLKSANYSSYVTMDNPTYLSDVDIRIVGYYCDDIFNESNLTWTNQYTEVVNCGTNELFNISLSSLSGDGLGRYFFNSTSLAGIITNDTDKLFTIVIKALPFNHSASPYFFEQASKDSGGINSIGTWADPFITYDYDYILTVATNITPTTAYVNNILYGYCNTTGPLSTNITYNMTWYNGSTVYSNTVSLNLTGTTVNVSVPANTIKKNEVWTFNCTVNTTTYASNKSIITISNTAPITQTTRINPTPTASITQSLEGYCNVTDIDNENITYNYLWYRNNTIYNFGTDGSQIQGTERLVSNLSPTTTLEQPPYYWSLDNVDVSGQTFIGTGALPLNMTGYNTLNTGIAAIVNQGVEIEDTVARDYIYINDTFTFNTSFTFSIVYNLESLTAGDALLCKSDGTTSAGSSYCFRMVDANIMEADFWTTAATTVLSNSSSFGAIGVPIHTVITYDTDTNLLTFYMNGTHAGSGVMEHDFNILATPTAIGRYGSYNGNYLDANYIDEFKIWNRALTAGEVYQDYQNTMKQLSRTDSNQTVTNTHVGDSFNFSCYGTDENLSSSSWLTSNETNITAGLSVVANITPMLPYTNDTLYGYCNSSSSVNQSINYTYVWFKNNTINSTGTLIGYYIGQSVNTTTISPVNTTKGDVWTLECNVTSSTASATDNESVTILNTVPIIQSARILPTNPFDTQDLNGYCNVTDLDGENITYYYKWYRNNTLYSENIDGSQIQGIERLVNTLDSASTLLGETWVFSCLGNDSTNTTLWLNSTNVSIESLTVLANITPVIAYTNDTLYGYCNSSSSSNLTVGYHYDWLRNGSINTSGDSNLTLYQEYANTTTYVGPYIYVNYTKPQYASGAKWRVLGGTIPENEITLPLDCWNSNPNELILRMYVKVTAGPGHSFECYNGTTWNSYQSESAGFAGGCGAFPPAVADAATDGDWTTSLSYNEFCAWLWVGPWVFSEDFIYEEGINWTFNNYLGQQINVAPIVPEYTTKGDNWTLNCTVITNITQLSDFDNVTILNTPPVIQTSRITPAVAYDTNDLNGYCNVTDIDNENVTYYYKWYRNGTEYSSGTDGSQLQGQERLVNTLSNTNTLTGETWLFSCLGNDTTNVSSWLNSSNVTIKSLVANATVLPIIAYTNDTLLGFCNSSSNINGSVLYNYSWLKNGAIQFSISTQYCYQEQANESSTCGGLSNGTYYWYNDIAGPELFFINYTKPTNTYLGSIWQIKIDNFSAGTYIQNITIPSICWNNNPNILEVRVRWGGVDGSTIAPQCYNGSDWMNIGVSTTGVTVVGGPFVVPYPMADSNWATGVGIDGATWRTSNNEVYEEAMYWNMTISQTVGTQITTDTISPILTTKNDIWSLACTVDDGYFNTTNTVNRLINNTLPITQTSRLSPTTAYTSQTLSGYCNVTDLDVENVTYYYRWYRNNTLYSENIDGSQIQGVERLVATMPPTNTSVGETWNFSCLGNDNPDNSSWITSTSVLINEPSYITSLYVSPSYPTDSSDLACNFNVNSLISNTLNARVTWYKSTDMTTWTNINTYDYTFVDVAKGVLQTTTLGTGSLPNAETTNYEHWKCEVNISNSYSNIINRSIMVNLYPLESLTIYSPSTNLSTNQSFFNVNFSAVDYDGGIACSLNINGTTLSTQKSLCYQESTNVANQGLAFGNLDGSCGQFYNGTYYESGAYIYINYTKPIYAIGSVWQVKHVLWGINGSQMPAYNITLPNECFGLGNTLQLRTFSDRNIFSIRQSHFECYNEVMGSWILVGLNISASGAGAPGGPFNNSQMHDGNWSTFSFQTGGRWRYNIGGGGLEANVYEEAIYWNISEIFNGTPKQLNYTLPVNGWYDWNVSCYSVTNPSPITSLQNTLLYDTVIPYTDNYTDTSTGMFPQIYDTINLGVTAYDNFYLDSCILEINDNTTWWNYSTSLIGGGTSQILTLPFTVRNVSHGNGTLVYWRVYCNDSVGQTNVSDIQNFTVKDVTTPYIDISNIGINTNNRTILTSTIANLSYNLTFYDENLFQAAVNITCDQNGTIHYWENLNFTPVTNYTKATTVALTGMNPQKCTMFIQASDSHTAKEIKPYATSEIDNGLAFDTGVSTINIISMDEVADTSTRKLNDRYTFDFGFIDDSTQRTFKVISDKKIYSIVDQYPGHFVVWDEATHTGNWIDFAINDGRDKTYTIEKINDNEYDVTIEIVVPEKIQTQGMMKGGVLGLGKTQMTEQEVVAQEYSLKNVRFESIGGLNINNASYEFYIGGTLNITTLNLYDNGTYITGYNITVWTVDSYPGTNQTFVNVNTTTPLIYNFTNGTYIINFTSTQYLPQQSIINFENMTQTLVYDTSESVVTINILNIKSGGGVTSANITVTNNNTLQSFNVVNDNVTSGNIWYLNASGYDLFVRHIEYYNYNSTFETTYHDNFTINVLMGFNASFILYDERTFDIFNISGADSINFLLFCPGATYTTAVTNYTFSLPILCNYTKFQFVLNYGATSYYRSYIFEPEDVFNQSIYLIDSTTTTYVYNSLILDDLFQDYIRPALYIKRVIGNQTVIITSDYVDMEQKVPAYLIENYEYIVELHSDNRPTRIMGTYVAAVSGDKSIRLYDVSVANTGEGFINGIQNDIGSINDSGSLIIYGIFNDTTNATSSVTFNVYAGSYGSVPIYTVTVPNPQSVEFTYNATPYENSTLYADFVVYNGLVKEGVYTAAKTIHTVNRVTLEVLQFVGQDFMNWFITILLGMIAIYSTMKTGNQGSLILVGAAALFVAFGWFQLSWVVIGLALLISILMILRKGDKNMGMR